MGMRDIMVLVLGYSCCESPEWWTHAIRSVATIYRIALGTPIDVVARYRWRTSSATWRGSRVFGPPSAGIWRSGTRIGKTTCIRS